MISLDKTDEELLRLIERDPQILRKVLAKKVDLTVSAVNKRIGKLARANFLIPTVLVQKTVLNTRAMVLIEADIRAMEKQKDGYNDLTEFAQYISRDLPKRPDVLRKYGSVIKIEHVYIVFGQPNDLLLIISGDNAIGICNFVTGILRHLNGVKNSRSALLYSPLPTSK